MGRSSKYPKKYQNVCYLHIAAAHWPRQKHSPAPAPPAQKKLSVETKDQPKKLSEEDEDFNVRLLLVSRWDVGRVRLYNLNGALWG